MKKIGLAFIFLLTLTSCYTIFGSKSSSQKSSSISSQSSKVISTSSSIESFSSSQSTSSLSLDEENLSYNGYYKDLRSWQNGEDLKNQLYDIIREGYTPCSYSDSTPNYESNIKADHSRNDFEYLDVAYSSEDIFYTQTNKGWQREHAFCASLMCGSSTSNAVKHKGRATDYHNLFAAYASGNVSRGNKNYGVANTDSSSYNDYTSHDGLDGYSYCETNFEPGHIDKGRLSRAIFYMATMYKEDEIDSKNNITMKGLRILEQPVSYISGNEGNFAIGNLSTLLSWNNEYAVDYLEMQHNISVYQDVISIDGYAQGNRNPYVDYPNLADYVFGDKKNEYGTFKDLLPTESRLKSNEHTFDHYAIKSAKREYELGTSIASSDFEIVKVYKDYTYEPVTEGYVHSLEDKTFSLSDGGYVNASILIDEQTLSYNIALNPMSSCASGAIYLDTIEGIDNKLPNQEQSVIYGGIDFLLSYTTSYAKVETDGVTISNIVTNGPGISFGSSTKPITSVIIKSVNTYEINAAFVKACVGNRNSRYELIIKVNDETLLAGSIIDNSDDVFRLYGTNLETSLYGQISFIFVGSSSIKINSIAFNFINA
ncbi:MAG TPA: hypothetical protein GX010_00680 [Erysipelotrichaceae bacterium]|nr:hypothetical protein [Erysipelotrichaceae bacterium]